MANIINEIPEELELEGEEVEVKENESEKVASEEKTGEVEVAKKEAEPVQGELDFDIEIEDDTPKADRNRKPLPEDIKQELEDDNLEEYSERVKTRMAQLKKAWHDERRAKEASDRRTQEAERIAAMQMQENKKLKETLSTGEEDYIKTLEARYQSDLAIAQREYKEAYDAGDSEKLVEAQTKMNEAQVRLTQTKDRVPQYSKETLQAEENAVSSGQETVRPQVPQPDAKALAWQEKNKWFGQDDEMTSLALGLHEKLVKSGVDPSSDQYYRSIDSTMQKRFPEYFGETDSLEEAKPAQRKPSTVVAPATRSTGPKKVRLTKTQLALAKKFKLTPEQYARELIKTETKNG
tara:strand:- start:7113 stop:8162 length:1050 start_codon:yes stop_codon:yes gene_type:complete